MSIGRDLACVLRAACVLAVMRLGLHLGRAALLRWRPRVAIRRNRDVSVEHVVRCVRHASRVVGGSCLARALASRLLLARAGVPVTLVVGAAENGPACLRAHAWIEHHGIPVVHGEPAPAFAARWRMAPAAAR